MPTLTTKCPKCDNGRLPDGSKCPTCNGLGFLIAKDDSAARLSFVAPPTPQNPRWFQIVLAVLATIAAIASAYTAAQSNKNAGTLDTVHSVQQENASRLKDIHKEVVPPAKLPVREQP
jgi:hypothetical protein